MARKKRQLEELIDFKPTKGWNRLWTCWIFFGFGFHKWRDIPGGSVYATRCQPQKCERCGKRRNKVDYLIG